jgi:hypothetical protein
MVARWAFRFGKSALVVLVLCLCALARPAAADATTVFNVHGTLDDGQTVTGTFAYDSSNLQITSFDISISRESFLMFPLDSSYAQVSAVAGGSVLLFGYTYDYIFYGLTFVLPTAIPPLPIHAITLCTDAPLQPGCYFDSYLFDGGNEFFTSGSITPLTATPEPSSLLLLGTGLLGLGPFIRRAVVR